MIVSSILDLKRCALQREQPTLLILLYSVPSNLFLLCIMLPSLFSAQTITFSLRREFSKKSTLQSEYSKCWMELSLGQVDLCEGKRKIRKESSVYFSAAHLSFEVKKQYIYIYLFDSKFSLDWKLQVYKNVLVQKTHIIIVEFSSANMEYMPLNISLFTLFFFELTNILTWVFAE